LIEKREVVRDGLFTSLIASRRQKIANKCVFGNYECLKCPQKEHCLIERAMVDASIILAIIKDEKNHKDCEEELERVKKEGKCFITHLGLAEVYKKTFEFIEEQVAEMYNECNRIETTKARRYEAILRTTNSLKQILTGFKILEIKSESIEKINQLLNYEGLRMGSRDRIILGIAESYSNLKFIFIDKGISGDSENLKNFGFKIKLESLN